MKTLFPPYARPAPGHRPADGWLVVDRTGGPRATHRRLGLIDLDLGARSLAEVLAAVEAWRADGVDGLYLDRAPASVGGLGQVALTLRVARRHGLRRVVLNPGAPTHPLYRGLGVQICVFEGPWDAYQRWPGDGSVPGDGHLVHSVPPALLTAARELLGRRGAGFGVATDASPANTRPANTRPANTRPANTRPADAGQSTAGQSNAGQSTAGWGAPPLSWPPAGVGAGSAGS